MSAPKNKIINKFSSRNIALTVKIVLWVVLLITTIAVFVPFSPEMPASTLDPSWMFGMNQATAQGLSFGKEIIYSFGPYASIYTKLYHPSTDFMMVSGSLYLALSYWAFFVLLMKDVQWRWVLAFCVLLAGVIYLRDPLLSSIPLLVGLLTFKCLLHGEGRLIKSKWAPFYAALLFAPLGLLALIKISLLALCVAVSALCSVFFAVKRYKLLAIICLLSPAVSILFFWIASGQSATNLPSYFISMAPIASGNTEAMAIDGNIREVILYLLASIFLLSAISINKQITSIFKIFLLCLYFVFLFLSFKHGFVRHDGHATISGLSILIAALSLPFILKTRISLPVIVFALLTWIYIDSNYNNTSTLSFRRNIESTYSSMWHGINNRIKNRNWPRLAFDVAVNSLREQSSFPVLLGTTDIYSYNQSYLIASGNSWSPRPIFQSHFAYTPALAETNRQHLLGGQAPDNIIFRIETIDGRIPSIDDGASWPILILNYRPTLMENDFLFLQKRESISDFEEPLKIKSEKHIFGESVLLPQSSQPVLAQLEIKPTILGRIASIFLKPSQLQITLELNNGIKKQYRIIAGMAESGFLISPLIENTAEFGMLYGKDGLLNSKLVKSLAIAPRDGKTLLWKDEYSITFRQVKLGTPIDLSKIYIAKAKASSNDSKNCLFNWAEINYPSLFSPVGASTQFFPPYSYRYYKHTNSYVSVSTANNHVYYLGPDGVLQDEGDLSSWLIRSNCK